ncbi:MAG: hypothetical protein WCP22_13185 [Chlamydiota bacterium]
MIKIAADILQPADISSPIGITFEVRRGAPGTPYVATKAEKEIASEIVEAISGIKARIQCLAQMEAEYETSSLIVPPGAGSLSTPH